MFGIHFGEKGRLRREIQSLRDLFARRDEEFDSLQEEADRLRMRLDAHREMRVAGAEKRHRIARERDEAIDEANRLKAEVKQLDAVRREIARTLHAEGQEHEAAVVRYEAEVAAGNDRISDVAAERDEAVSQRLELAAVHDALQIEFARTESRRAALYDRLITVNDENIRLRARIDEARAAGR